MKTTKYFLLTLILIATKFGQAQTVIDTMTIFPNPFTTFTTIHFEIAKNDTVTLEVYNLYGQTVRSFFNNTILYSGSYSVDFYADTLPNGLYIVLLKYGFNKQIAKKIVIQSSTSINDLTNNNKNFVLYPNPTKDLLTIPIDGQKIIIVTRLAV